MKTFFAGLYLANEDPGNNGVIEYKLEVTDGDPVIVKTPSITLHGGGFSGKLVVTRSHADFESGRVCLMEYTETVDPYDLPEFFSVKPEDFEVMNGFNIKN